MSNERTLMVVVKITELDDQMEIDMDVMGATSELERRGAVSMALESLKMHVAAFTLEEVDDED